MKKIEILGAGCAKCKKLHEMTQEAASQLKLECDIQYITDLQKIMAYGVMMTPALVVDGKVVISGKVPSMDDLKNIIGQVV